MLFQLPEGTAPVHMLLKTSIIVIQNKTVKNISEAAKSILSTVRRN